MDNSKKNDKNDKKGRAGCAIIMFLGIASGIPFVLNSESAVRTFGYVPLTIIGLVAAYFWAKLVYDN